MYTSSALEEDFIRTPSPPSKKHSPGPGESALIGEDQNTLKETQKHFTSSSLHHWKTPQIPSSFDDKSINKMASTSTSNSIKREWPPRLYLAIDCGGTKAAAALCNEQGEVIGRGQGGPANYTDIGLHSFLESVEDAVKIALAGARLFYSNLEENNGVEWQYSTISTTNRTQTQSQPQPFHEGLEWENDSIHSRPSTSGRKHGESGDESEHQRENRFSIQDALTSLKPTSIPSHVISPQFEAAWLGIAGVDSSADVTTLTPHLGKLLSIPFPGNRLIVANDTSLLASPIADSARPEIKSGVVAIAGTGSIVMSFRRKRNGMLRVLGRVGGFGWLIGDEGSGYSVGRTAVRKVLDLTDRERLDFETASMMQETKLDEDSDSDEEDEGTGEKSTLSKGEEIDDTMATFEMDGAKKEESKLLSINRTKTAEYGHQLRDRILQHWGLVSTDELLRAVYFDEAHGGQPNGRGVPAAAKPSVVNDTTSSSSSSETNCVVSVTDEAVASDDCIEGSGSNSLSRSIKTIRAEGISGQTLRSKLMKRFEIPKALADGEMNHSHSSTNSVDNRLSTSPTRTSRTSVSSMTDEPSTSLLPPSAHTLDAETRLRGASPIPSLSSSPGSRYSNTFSDVFPSPTGAIFTSTPSAGVSGGSNESNRINVSHDDPMRSADSYSSNQSALATELTSASSSLSMTMSTHGGRRINVESGLPRNKIVSPHEEDHEKIVGDLDNSSEGGVKIRSTLERKHRLASLAPLVFHLAFTHKDECSLEILRSQAYFMAFQIAEICNVKNPKSRAFLNVEKSTLCLGGSLVGVERYRDLLLIELRKLGIVFARVEFVGDPAKRGALALSHVMERSRQQQ